MADTQRFLVRFWGVRGSYPTPGVQTMRHGGNTSCIEVQAGEHTLILDAGSGIIPLGNNLLQGAQGKPLRLALLITHGHSDHLVGLPFFAPLFERQAYIACFGPFMAGRTIEQVVTTLMSPPYFPVDIHKLPSQRTFQTITAEHTIVWRRDQSEPALVTNGEGASDAPLRVRAMFTQSHPLNGSVFYRIEYGGKSLVYATDVEWQGQCDAEFMVFAQGTDLLIHDAQYTSEDYQQAKRGFGHSTVEMATGAAQAVAARELVLFHHEPTYDDNQLDRMEEEARAHFAHTLSAYEGLEIDLLASTEDK